MRKPRPLFQVLLCAALCAAFVTVAHAQTLFGDPSGYFISGNSNLTFGAAFTVGSQPIRVTALGVFDTGQDGLLDNHQVGLWGSSTLLSSTTVPSGTGTQLLGFYRYVPITPLILSANTTYTVGAFYSVDFYPLIDQIGEDGSAMVDPAISSVMLGLMSNPSIPVFAEPIVGFGRPLWAVNMQFTVVPEPGGAALVGAGFGALILFRRRRVRK
jgi:hypothetical protein